VTTPEVPYHCGVCGRGVVFVPWYVKRSNGEEGRFYHVLGSTPVYPDPDGMDWRIGHDAQAWPGRPKDRRQSEPDGDHFLYPEQVQS
jgi:hypothetical protein